MNNPLWSLKAKFYRSLRSSFPFNFILKEENKKLELILGSIEVRNKTIVDLGTGAGNVLQYLVDSKLTIGIDFTFSMLQSTRQSYPGVYLLQTNTMALPIKNNSIEVVTAVGLSEYLKNIELFFKETFRILKNDGFLVLTFSPRGIWSRLRLLLGHAIYTRTLTDLITIAKGERFQIIKNSNSSMQSQVLFQKI
jgi:ubiquinone/menaquinone biosynthesis C-methylase UbiE